ncbi:MAG: adenylate/guanylate cyclase domain-containing protein [Armatimonadetes bacterium]|nr:adenylate/guanylate cyclase domain-containing protein [Armatimonadota bacterium]
MAATSPFTLEVRIVGFADLAGFQVAAERLDLMALAAALQGYYEAVDRIVSDHGGRVVKFIGDAVLFCFPAGADVGANQRVRPAIDQCIRPAIDQRVRPALACARELARAAAARAAADFGGAPLALSVGLEMGDVVSGEFGAPGRRTFDLFGRTVNTAAILCRGQGIIVGEAFRAALGDAVAIEPLPPIRRPNREIPAYRVR